MAEYFFVDTNKLVGERVAFYRNERKMTQEKLAETIGVTRKHINEIEMGKVDATTNELCKISQALSVNVEDILSTAQFHDINIVGDKEVRYIKSIKVS